LAQALELPRFDGHLTKPDNGLGGVDGKSAQEILS